MNKNINKDKFSLYVFIVIISSTIFSTLLMTLLNKIFNQYRAINYVIFACLSFLLSSCIASYIISLLLKHSKEREHLLLTLLDKVSKSEFSFRFESSDNDEMMSDINNFNKILQELDSVAILKEDFISNFSHEFKTPITSIKGFAEILQSKPNLSEDEKKDYLQIIIDESTRLSMLSKNTLLMSKLDSQSCQENKSTFFLDEQLRELILMLDYEFSQKNINTEINLEKIKICACKELLLHIWTNLLTNAIKFTNDEIQINAFVKNEFIIVQVIDNGIGIDKKNLKNIFDKYYQCDTSHKSSGNGLGLSIVKKVVELVDGKIEVESDLNQGTTFSVYLKNELNN